MFDIIFWKPCFIRFETGNVTRIPIQQKMTISVLYALHIVFYILVVVECIILIIAYDDEIVICIISI